MTEQLSKYAGIIPLAAIIVYILGYLCLSTYLQSYNIEEDILLEFKTLKLGIIFSIITAPVILLTFATFQIGSYSNTELENLDELIRNIHDALGYSLLYSMSLSGILFGYKLDGITIAFITFLLIATVLNKLPMHQNLRTFLKGMFLLVPFFSFIILYLRIPNSGKAMLYFLQLLIFTACATYRIFNKPGATYQFSKIGIIITTVFSATSLFGGSILKYIPSKYGGEMKTNRIYYINDTDLLKVKQTSLNKHLKNNIIVSPMIYSNSDTYYFMLLNNQIVSVPKSYIGATEIAAPITK